MPNWCFNSLRIVGEPEELKRFLDANMGLPAKYPPVYAPDGKLLIDSPEDDEPHFCFNALVPTPLDSPEGDEPYFCFNALVPTPQEVLDVGFSNCEETDKDGNPVIDGYSWSIKNWGTKWDIYYYNITLDKIGWYEGCGSVEINFDTAWSPAYKWLESVVKMFPDLCFDLYYEEPGCCFAGDLYGAKGKFYDVPYSEEQCKQIFEWLEDEDDEPKMIGSGENSEESLVSLEQNSNSEDQQIKGKDDE